MSAYAEICSLFEARQKMEEEYSTAAYTQFLTFVELFEFYIGCETKERVVPLRIDEDGLPLPDQTAPFRFVDHKLDRRRLRVHGRQSAFVHIPPQRQAAVAGGMFPRS
ncbi:MAG: hypothetical protein V8Q84_02250, partial [Bilophila sp.]